MLGYTALDAGLAMSPGAVVTLITMPLVGFLLGKYQPRWLIVIGLVIGAFGIILWPTFNLAGKLLARHMVANRFFRRARIFVHTD